MISLFLYRGRNSKQLKPKKDERDEFLHYGWFALTEDPDVGRVLTVDGTGRDVDDVAMRDDILALDESYSVGMLESGIDPEGDVITLGDNSQLG